MIAHRVKGFVLDYLDIVAMKRFYPITLVDLFNLFTVIVSPAFKMFAVVLKDSYKLSILLLDCTDAEKERTEPFSFSRP